MQKKTKKSREEMLRWLETTFPEFYARMVTDRGGQSAYFSLWAKEPVVTKSQ